MKMNDIISFYSSDRKMKKSSSTSSSLLTSCSSFRLIRSRSSALISNSIPSESARYTSYERISHSMRLDDDDDSFPSSLDWSDDSRSRGDGNPPSSRRRRRNRGLSSRFSRLFSFLRPSSGESGGGKKDAEKESARRKPGSSGLPDSNRRWPVQGWG